MASPLAASENSGKSLQAIDFACCFQFLDEGDLVTCRKVSKTFLRAFKVSRKRIRSCLLKAYENQCFSFGQLCSLRNSLEKADSQDALRSSPAWNSKEFKELLSIHSSPFPTTWGLRDCERSITVVRECVFFPDTGRYMMHASGLELSGRGKEIYLREVQSKYFLEMQWKCKALAGRYFSYISAKQVEEARKREDQTLQIKYLGKVFYLRIEDYGDMEKEERKGPMHRTKSVAIFLMTVGEKELRQFAIQSNK